MVKNLPANAGDPSSIPGWGRSPGGGNGNPLQYSCLGNPRIEKPGGLQSMELQRVRHDEGLSMLIYTHTHNQRILKGRRGQNDTQERLNLILLALKME